MTFSVLCLTGIGILRIEAIVLGRLWVMSVGPDGDPSALSCSADIFRLPVRSVSQRLLYVSEEIFGLLWHLLPSITNLHLKVRLPNFLHLKKLQIYLQQHGVTILAKV